MKTDYDSCKNRDLNDRKCSCFDPDNWEMSFYVMTMVNKFSPLLVDIYLFI